MASPPGLSDGTSTQSPEPHARGPEQQGDTVGQSPAALALLSTGASVRLFSCPYSLAQAWVDEMDFAAQNPLISSILNSISQITGVVYTVIALGGGHAQNFMLKGSVLFIFLCLPPIYTEVHGSHYEDTLNMQRNVIAEIQHTLLAINLGSLAGSAWGEIC